MLSKKKYIRKNKKSEPHTHVMSNENKFPLKKPLNMWPRISHAIVMTDALNIHEGILKLKKAVLQRRAA